MDSNSDVIRKALVLIGVLDEVESVSAEQGESGLQAMNDMLLEWGADGIDTGFYPQTDINDDSPVYLDAMQAVKYSLAVYLSNEYGVEPSKAVVAIAFRSYNRLLRDAINAKIEEADMGHLPGAWVRSNILEG